MHNSQIPVQKAVDAAGDATFPAVSQIAAHAVVPLA
jgi:hypothetical protein